MEKVFVDTSAWVALFVKNDINHKKAITAFEKIKKSKYAIYTSDYVIDETITTILVRGNHRQSVIAGDALLSSKNINIIHVNPDYFEDTWKKYQKYKDKQFSFTDVSCFTIMKYLDINSAFTFDKDFVQASITII